MSLYLEHFIKEKINVELRKIQLSMQKEEKEIRRVLEKEGYRIKYINFQNNSINGVIERNNQKFFFKLLDNQDFNNEITGYIVIKDKFPVNKIEEIYEFQNCCIIVYEYENTIHNNEGLLNDFLVQNDEKIKENPKQIIQRIISLYRNSFKTTITNSQYPMQQFYQDRIESRLIEWYNKEKNFEYKVNIDGVKGKKTSEIIKEVINFFNKEHKLECSLSQGDPNTLNIGIKPIFFDFATSGYNPIICEFSTIFWSVLIADAYFCPKYHPKSYYNHKKVFENIDKFTPNLQYEVNDIEKKINIQSNIKTSKIRIDFIKEYMKMLEDLNAKIGKEFIYFLAMRILCIFNISKMEEKDYFYSIFILHYLYENISDDVYDSLKTIINKFESM